MAGFMDNFHEEIVVKKNRGLNNALYVVLWAFLIVFALTATIYLSAILRGFDVYTLVVLLVSLGMCALIWWKKDDLRMEYDYTFTNGEMDFARVLGQQKRKSLGSMRVRNVEALGYVKHSAFQRYVSMPGVEKLNWFLNRDADLFYFYFQKDGKKRMIVIEPSEELVKLIKQYAAHGAFQG